jgi:hypothetical protein
MLKGIIPIYPGYVMISALYVDDDPSFLEIGKMFLEQSGMIQILRRYLRKCIGNHAEAILMMCF